jgi:hypothetical protein
MYSKRIPEPGQLGHEELDFDGKFGCYFTISLGQLGNKVSFDGKLDVFTISV